MGPARLPASNQPDSVASSPPGGPRRPAPRPGYRRSWADCSRAVWDARPTPPWPPSPGSPSPGTSRHPPATWWRTRVATGPCMPAGWRWPTPRGSVRSPPPPPWTGWPGNGPGSPTRRDLAAGDLQSSVHATVPPRTAHPGRAHPAGARPRGAGRAERATGRSGRGGRRGSTALTGLRDAARRPRVRGGSSPRGGHERGEGRAALDRRRPRAPPGRAAGPRRDRALSQGGVGEGPATRVVIAEDEAIIRLDLKEILLSAGYDVVGETGRGDEAVALVEAHQPDLAILDVKMPGMDGVRAAREITSRHKVAVLVLTAFSQRDLIEDARDAGVAAYLVKPFRREELLPAIEGVLARCRQEWAIDEEAATLSAAGAADDKIETRRIVDEAKALLIERHRMSEGDAFAFIQRTAMQTRA